MSDKPFLPLGDTSLTKEEAGALAALKSSAAWDALRKVLDANRSDTVSRIVSRRATPEETNFDRGYLAALADLIGQVENEIPDAFLARIAAEEDVAKRERGSEGHALT